MNPAALRFSKRALDRRGRLSHVPALRAFASLMILSAAACRRDGAVVGGTGGAGATGGTGGGRLDGGIDGTGTDAGMDVGVGGNTGSGGSAGNTGGSAGSTGGSAGSTGGSAGGRGGGGGGAGAGGARNADAAVDLSVDAAASDGSVDTGPAAATLKSAAAQSGRLIGAAIGASHLSEAAYAATAAAAFDFVTPENEMKWDATEPAQNVFTFAAGDAITSFARQNGMKVKGHNLVWHSQLPDWVSAITDPTALHDAMINHVTQVGSHYRGQVMAWDVVNEAVADGGQSLRNSIFYQYLGAGYIDDAFKAAHAADPGALLFYNEYGAEGGGAKSDFVYNMVKGMLARGVPINGVGLQMHTGPADTSPSAVQVTTNMQRLEALGLNVMISEMDVQICAGNVDSQRIRFHDIVAVCVAEPLCLAVTAWGVSDKYSWLNGGTCATPQPLLFDGNYAPKPAYAGVLNAFLGL
jgi:endo-1,4-beta-xylanase